MPSRPRQSRKPPRPGPPPASRPPSSPPDRRCAQHTACPPLTHGGRWLLALQQKICLTVTYEHGRHPLLARYASRQHCRFARGRLLPLPLACRPGAIPAATARLPSLVPCGSSAACVRHAVRVIPLAMFALPAAPRVLVAMAPKRNIPSIPIQVLHDFRSLQEIPPVRRIRT